MKLGFVVNDLEKEIPGYSTTRMAVAAINSGHEIWYVTVGDFAFDPDGKIRARGRSVTKDRYKLGKTLLADLLGPQARTERITVSDLDVLMLRNDPSEDKRRRGWAQTAGIQFGRACMKHGVIVLNDPNGLAKAMNKMYFQLFPDEVRPRTMVTRDRNDIRAFARDQGGDIVIKPLAGRGGDGVFIVRRDDLGNLNQIIDAVSRDGYVVAQEYLPEAEKGDLRLFMMNGQPLRHKGKYAAFRRVRIGDDIRSNIAAGGKKVQAEVDSRALRVADIVRPKLVEDGMFLVGLDIVGDKLMEINVFSPGGLGSAQSFENVNFAQAVIQALERKVTYMGFYHRNFNNVDMAML